MVFKFQKPILLILWNKIKSFYYIHERYLSQQLFLEKKKAQNFHSLFLLWSLSFCFSKKKKKKSVFFLIDSSESERKKINTLLLFVPQLSILIHKGNTTTHIFMAVYNFMIIFVCELAVYVCFSHVFSYLYLSVSDLFFLSVFLYSTMHNGSFFSQDYSALAYQMVIK